MTGQIFKIKGWNISMSKLYTKHLVLREFNENDAPAIYSHWAYDQRVAKYCRWYPHDSVAASAELLKMYL